MECPGALVHWGKITGTIVDLSLATQAARGEIITKRFRTQRSPTALRLIAGGDSWGFQRISINGVPVLQDQASSTPAPRCAHTAAPPAMVRLDSLTSEIGKPHHKPQTGQCNDRGFPLVYPYTDFDVCYSIEGWDKSNLGQCTDPEFPLRSPENSDLICYSDKGWADGGKQGFLPCSSDGSPSWCSIPTTGVIFQSNECTKPPNCAGPRGCWHSKYGCCPNGLTAKGDEKGSNCRVHTFDSKIQAVRVYKVHSVTQPIAGRNYGYKNNTLWVEAGLKATFLVWLIHPGDGIPF